MNNLLLAMIFLFITYKLQVSAGGIVIITDVYKKVRKRKSMASGLSVFYRRCSITFQSMISHNFFTCSARLFR